MALVEDTLKLPLHLGLQSPLPLLALLGRGEVVGVLILLGNFPDLFLQFFVVLFEDVNLGLNDHVRYEHFLDRLALVILLFHFLAYLCL